MKSIFPSIRSWRTGSARNRLRPVLSALSLVLLLTGCTKCEQCELNNNSETICETEFDSPEQYQDAIADQEALGAVCTPTGGI